MKRQLLAAEKTETDLAVSGVQTGEWTRMMKETCSTDANMSIVERVNMMTPEFMVDVGLYAVSIPPF